MEETCTMKKIINQPAELQSLERVRDFIETLCKTHPEVDEQAIYDLKLAADEACTNIILYGYQGVNSGMIKLVCGLEDSRAIIQISDSGRPFNLGERPKPEIASGLDNSPMGGFGLYFIYQTMDEVSYKTDDLGNHLTLVKKLKSHPDMKEKRNGDQFRREN